MQTSKSGRGNAHSLNILVSIIEIVVTPRERKYGWAGLCHSEKILAQLYSIIGLVAAY